MKVSEALKHPAVYLLAYLLVPLTIDLMTALNLAHIFPDSRMFVLRTGSLLVAVSWGWVGLFVCILLGILFGLPVAGLQAAYFRSRLLQIREGVDRQEDPDFDPWIGGLAPWLVMVGVVYLVGRAWVFPPIGGILLAVNVLWARSLVYPVHLLAYEYRRADQELREEEAAAGAHVLPTRPLA